MEHNEALVGELRRYLRAPPSSSLSGDSAQVRELRRELNLAARAGQQVLMQLHAAERSRDAAAAEIAQLKAHSAQLAHENAQLAADQRLVAAQLDAQDAEITKLGAQLAAQRRHAEQLARATAAAQALEREVEMLSGLQATLRAELEASNTARDEAASLAQRLAEQVASTLVRPALAELRTFCDAGDVSDAGDAGDASTAPSDVSVTASDASDVEVSPIDLNASLSVLSLDPRLRTPPHGEVIASTPKVHHGLHGPPSQALDPEIRATTVSTPKARRVPADAPHVAGAHEMPSLVHEMPSLVHDSLTLDASTLDTPFDASETRALLALNRSELAPSGLVRPAAKPLTGRPHTDNSPIDIPQNSTQPHQPAGLQALSNKPVLNAQPTLGTPASPEMWTRRPRSRSHESIFAPASPLRPRQLDAASASRTLAAVNGQHCEPAKPARGSARDALWAMRAAPDRKRWAFFLN